MHIRDIITNLDRFFGQSVCIEGFMGCRIWPCGDTSVEEVWIVDDPRNPRRIDDRILIAIPHPHHIEARGWAIPQAGPAYPVITTQRLIAKGTLRRTEQPGFAASVGDLEWSELHSNLGSIQGLSTKLAFLCDPPGVGADASIDQVLEKVGDYIGKTVSVAGVVVSRKTQTSLLVDTAANRNSPEHRIALSADDFPERTVGLMSVVNPDGWGLDCWASGIVTGRIELSVSSDYVATMVVSRLVFRNEEAGAWYSFEWPKVDD